MTFPGKKKGLLDRFSVLATKVKSTAARNVKDTTRATYTQHLNGKYGWLTFLRSFAAKFNVEVTDLPTKENYDEYTDILTIYFQIRTLTGFDEDVGIQLTDSNEPLDAPTSYIVYSAIKDYLKCNGYLENHPLNPLSDDFFQNYVKGWKAKIAADKLNNKKKGSEPLFYEDMIELMKGIPSTFNDPVMALWFSAICSTCYSCFFRINELLNLQMEDVKVKIDEDGLYFIEITLWERKTILKEPHSFLIYDNQEEFAINAFFYLTQYISYLKSTGELSNPKQYFFGRLAYSKLRFDYKQQNSQKISLMLKQVLQNIGLNSVEYSSHTFRKGGARHKFLYSKSRWNLDTIMVWCGWSHSDDNHVLWSYLAESELGRKRNDAMKAMKYGTVQPSIEEMHKIQMAAIAGIGQAVQNNSVIFY